MTIKYPSNQSNNGNAASELQPNNGTSLNNGVKDQFNIPLPSLQGDWEQEVERPKTRSRQHQESSLRAKIVALAIAIGMLPVLAVGTATYYFGSKTITEQTTQFRRTGSIGREEAELIQQKQLQLLATLLVGTGATVFLSGTLAALWSNLFLRGSATKVATTAQATVQTKLFTDAVVQIWATIKQEDILKTAVEVARKAISADRVIVYSLDENSRGTVIAEAVVPGWPRALPRALGTTVRDHYFEAMYLEKYQNGRVVAIDDIYKASLAPCHQEILETYAIRASLVAPLLNEKKLIGLLVAHQCSSPRVWQQSEIDLFAQIATQVGFALDNAQLIAERSSLKEQLEIETKWKQFFADTTQLIHGLLSEEDVLKAVVEEARRVLAADRVLIYSVIDESFGVVIAESVAPGWPKALKKEINDPCFQARYIEKYENGRVRALNNIYEAGITECYIEQLEALAVKANLVVPVLHEGKLLGLLVAHQCSGPRDWKPIEIKWFTQIAIQVGFALDNIKLTRRIEQMNLDALAVANKWREEKAALQQQITAIIRDSEAVEAFSTKASRQAETLTDAIAQIQALADTARSITANAEKAEIQLQQVTVAIQAGHESVNQTVDSITAIGETFAEVSSKLKSRDEAARKLYQFINVFKDLVAQINRHAINAAIESGRNGDTSQHSVMVIAEAVRAITQQLTKAAADIEPTVAELETEAEDLAVAIETGSMQVAAEMELTKATRQKLNQLATISAKLSALVNSIADFAATQAEKSTFTSNTVLEVANITNRTSEQSLVLIKSFNKLAAMCHNL